MARTTRKNKNGLVRKAGGTVDQMKQAAVASTEGGAE